MCIFTNKLPQAHVQTWICYSPLHCVATSLRHSHPHTHTHTHTYTHIHTQHTHTSILNHLWVLTFPRFCSSRHFLISFAWVPGHHPALCIASICHIVCLQSLHTVCMYTMHQINALFSPLTSAEYFAHTI